MKLYSGPLSLFTAKVRIALAEKRLDYERIEVGWSLADRYLPHHPDVVALNPKCEVPVLVDGDLVVYDSTVILEYLEERHPGVPLYPSDLAERARCRQFEAAADEILFPCVWALIEEGLYPVGEAGRDPERLEAAKRELNGEFEKLDKRLAGREYLCGDFTVADIGTYIFINTAVMLGAPPAQGLSSLQAWLDRTGARPTVRAEVHAMQAFLAQAMGGE